MKLLAEKASIVLINIEPHEVATVTRLLNEAAQYANQCDRHSEIALYQNLEHKIRKQAAAEPATASSTAELVSRDDTDIGDAPVLVRLTEGELVIVRNALKDYPGRQLSQAYAFGKAMAPEILEKVESQLKGPVYDEEWLERNCTRQCSDRRKIPVILNTLLLLLIQEKPTNRKRVTELAKEFLVCNPMLS